MILTPRLLVGPLHRGIRRRVFPSGKGLISHNRGITVPIPVLGSTFTIETWMMASGSSAQRLLETNEFTLSVIAGVASFVAGGVTVTGGSGLADGYWHHVVVTYTGGNVRVYVDGVLVAGPTALTVNLVSTSMYLGTDATHTVNLNGRMANVAVYTTALNLAQIDNHYGLSSDTTVLTSVMTVRDRQFDVKTGTVTNGVTFSQTGPLGDSATAVAFDGLTGFIDAGDQASFDFDKQFSIETWFKSSTTGLLPLVTKTIAAGNGWGLFLNSGAIRTWAYTAAAASIFDVSVGSGYNDGAWHHVVITWDFTTTAGHVKVYVDGVSVGTGTASSTAQQGSAGHTLRMGYRADSAGNFYAGSLANVALYWYELTAAQVAAHYVARLSTFSYSAETVGAETRTGVARAGFSQAG